MRAELLNPLLEATERRGGQQETEEEWPVWQEECEQANTVSPRPREGQCTKEERKVPCVQCCWDAGEKQLRSGAGFGNREARGPW